MDKKRCRLIINPIAGTSDKKGLERIVEERLRPLDLEIDVAWTTAHGDATRLAREAVDRGYHAVIAAGGDGTINESAAALCHSGVAFGIIPCGSGNGLARHLDIPVDIEASVDIIAQNHLVDCDYGTVNSRPFFCTFGVGFDAAVSAKFAQGRRRGRLAYIRNTILEYISYNPQEYVIAADGNVLTEKAFLVAVCNASQYGNNAYIAPRASMVDGLLDVTIIHQGSPLTTALVGVDMLTGYIDRNTLIHTFRTSKATIVRNSPGPVHLDGEPLELGTRMDIGCHKGALRIFTPTDDRPFRPIITPVTSMMRELHYTVRNFFQLKT